jgi:hypothetical protein
VARVLPESSEKDERSTLTVFAAPWHDHIVLLLSILALFIKICDSA